MEDKGSNTILERLIYLGIATFFIWPLAHLCLMKSLPVSEKSVSFKVANFLQNSMENALAGSHEPTQTSDFVPVSGCEDIGLLNKIEVLQHPDYENIVIIKSSVKWGEEPFIKSLNLECSAPKYSSYEKTDLDYSVFVDNKRENEIDLISNEIANSIKMTTPEVGKSSSECRFFTTDEAFAYPEEATEKIFLYNGLEIVYKESKNSAFEEKRFNGLPALLKSCRNVKFNRISKSLIELTYILPKNEADNKISKLVYLRNIK